MKFTHLQQHDTKDCGAACLSMICSYYGLHLPMARYRELVKVDNQGANIWGIVSGAKKLGLDACALEGDLNELLDGISSKEIVFPFIARIANDSGYLHFIVVFDMKSDYFIVGDPGKDKTSKLKKDKFAAQWLGNIITFDTTEQFRKGNHVRESFKKFYKCVLNEKKIFIFILFISLLITIINMLGSFALEYIINHAILNSSREMSNPFFQYIENILNGIYANLNIICIAIISFYILGFMITILRDYIFSYLLKKIDLILTSTFYNHMVDLRFDFFATWKTGELLSRFMDISKITNAISSAVISIVFDTVMALGCGILLIMMSKPLFLVTVIMMGLYTAVVFLFRNPIKKTSREIMEKEAKIMSFLKESIAGIITIKSYGNESFMKKTLYDLYDRFAKTVMKNEYINSTKNALVNLVSAQ